METEYKLKFLTSADLAGVREVIQNVPSAAQAMGAVIASVPDIIAYIKSK